MSVMSLLRAARPNMVVSLTPKGLAQNVVRNLRTTEARAGGDQMQIYPSRYQWNKYKDHLHFYIMLGAVPLGLITFYANVFIGPSTLAEIPEGYVPKQYEYFKHPVSRFIAKHFQANYQETYERNIFYIFESDERKRMRRLSWRVEKLMQERGDYPNYYTNRTTIGKYIRTLQTERDRSSIETPGEDD